MQPARYCYADDIKDYWIKFDNGESLKELDIDSTSQILQKDLCELYKSRTVSSGEQYLNSLATSNNNYYYLYLTKDKNLRFGADSIGYLHYIEDFLKNNNHKKEQKFYVKITNTIGGKIIFPKNGISNSINIARNRKLCDRFDLTLECIRRFYYNEESKMTEIFSQGVNKKFFNIFGYGETGFKNYVEFFFLNDLVSKDNQVIFFTEDSHNLKNLSDSTKPLTTYSDNPQKCQELYSNIIAFITKRNLRIQRSLNKK